VLVRGNPYPIVRMDWVNGDTLNLFLDKRSGNASVVENIRASFRAMASTLHRAGIARGDIQNLNVVVVGTELRAKSRPIYRFSRPRKSSFSSTSKPRKRSASTFRHRCSCAPTR
jgi:hypothetical protein